MVRRTVARQCTLCEAHCGIVVTVDDGRVTGIEGDPDDVLSQGYVCPKATALADLHTDPERLRHPIRKVGDGWEQISWKEAFELVGSSLRRIRRESGKDAIGMYLGNPAAHSPSVIWGVALRAALLTRRFWSASSVDQFPQEFAAKRMFGANGVLPVADIDRTDRLVIMGANPAVSNGSLTTMPDARRRIKAVRERGGTVVVIDPRRTETARIADEHVAVKPGGDPFLLAGMLHVLLADGLEPTPHLAKRLDGWAQVASLLDDCTPERMAPRAGVEPEVIARLAREHTAASRALVYARIGVCQHVTGTLTHWLVNVVNAMTGNLDRAGGQMFPKPPIDITKLTKGIDMPYGNWTDRKGKHKAFRWELPVAGMADDIGEPGDDRVRALVTYAGNPVLSSANAGRLDEALASLDFYVAVDMYVTETTRHADVILPPVSQLEREEYDFVFPMFSVRNNARYNARVFEPPSDGLEDWEILARLTVEVSPLPARGLVGPIAAWTAQQLSPMRMSALGVAAGPWGVLRRGPRGLTMRKIRTANGGIDLGPLEPRLDELIATDDGKVRLAPPDIVAEMQRVLAEHVEEPDDDFDLRLIGRRHLRSNNSWMHNVESMVKGRDRCTVLMHPADAAGRDLQDCQRVVVTSRVGQIEVPLEVSDEIRLGTVAIPHGWGHDTKGVGWSTAAAHGGANVNLLHDPDNVETFTGNGALNGTWVRVEAAENVAALGA